MVEMLRTRSSWYSWRLGKSWGPSTVSNGGGDGVLEPAKATGSLSSETKAMAADEPP
jgi:hypothetical protein